MKQNPASAPALARGLTLLAQLAVDGHTSLEKLAARNGWPKSSVLRFLQTLEQAGAVKQDPESRRWRALQHLQALDAPNLGSLEMARKRLAVLAQLTGHCAELYRWQNGELSLMDRAEPETGEMMILARIGFLRDLKEWDATALTVFAFSPDAQVPEKVWAWKKGKKKKLSSEKRDQRLSELRETQVAMDADFNENGIRRFAIPVFQSETLVGVLAVAQRQTPRADTETDFIKQTLHPMK